MSYLGKVRPTVALTSSDIEDNAVTSSKIIADAVTTAKINDGDVTTAKMATDPTNATNLASGTVPTARLGSGSASSSTFLTGAQTYAAVDTSGITANQDDIALLGFKVAANGSLAKYNLVDQTIDAFEDASGVDASASTNEIRDSSGKYYSSTSSSAASAAWVFGASASGASYGTTIQGGGGGTDGVWTNDRFAGNDISKVFDSTVSQDQQNCSYDGGSNECWVGKDAGAGITQTASDWTTRGSSDYGWNNPGTNGSTTIALEYSSDNISWTEAASVATSATPGTVGSSFTETAAYRYWRIKRTAGSSDLRCSDFSLYGVKYTDSVSASMTLISNATTAADGAPTIGDLVITYTDGAGTATVNTDIKAYISRDGSAYTSAVTLVSQGTSGGHTILTANGVDLSGITTGTSMRWKIETLNQAVDKQTRIQAVSLGWS